MNEMLGLICLEQSVVTEVPVRFVGQWDSGQFTQASLLWVLGFGVHSWEVKQRKVGESLVCDLTSRGISGVPVPHPH